MDPKAANVLVETLGSSLRYGGTALADVPDLLKNVLQEDAWKEFVTRQGETVHHERYINFITTEPLAGLGASEEIVRRVIAADPVALDLHDKALAIKPGQHRANDNIKSSTGTAKDQALRKLRRDAPELHARVLGGELSPHAAMVEAGFRHRSQSIRIDDPESAARALRKHMPPKALSRLINLLSEDGSG